MKKYYEAYEKRYQRVHEYGLLWFKSEPTPELINWISFFNIPLKERVLEVGCGEGRDVIYMAGMGYQMTATDISEEAIKTCIKMSNDKNINISFKVEDFVCKDSQELDMFNWIYSIGTLHMLVDEEDRKRFLRNLYGSLAPFGKLLLINKGDGKKSFKTDKDEAFHLVDREHFSDNKEIKLEATSFCMKSWIEHIEELEETGFIVEKKYNSKNEFYDDCMIVYLRK